MLAAAALDTLLIVCANIGRLSAVELKAASRGCGARRAAPLVVVVSRMGESVVLALLGRAGRDRQGDHSARNASVGYSEGASYRPECRERRNRENDTPVHQDESHTISARDADREKQSHEDTEPNLRHWGAKHRDGDMARLTTQGDANSHFSRPLRGDEGKERVNARERQEHNDRHQDCRHPEQQPVNAQIRHRDLIEPDDVVELKRRIDVRGNGTHPRCKDEWIASQVDGYAYGVTPAGRLRVIDAGRRRRVPGLRGDADIRNDADDLMPRLSRGPCAGLSFVRIAKAPSDRVAVAEHQPREGLVHNNARRAGPESPEWKARPEMVGASTTSKKSRATLAEETRR